MKIGQKRRTPSRVELLQEYYSAPSEALFSAPTIAAVMGCSLKTLERRRGNGDGPPYIKDGNRVMYPKAGVQEYLSQCGPYTSTTQADVALKDMRAKQLPYGGSCDGR